MGRLAKYASDGSFFNQLAGVHHADAYGELGHEPHVVSDEEHGCVQLFLNLPKRLNHLSLYNHVQCAGRFICDHETGAQAHGERNAHSLFHAAAELVGVNIGDLGFQADAGPRDPQVVRALRRH